MQRTILSFLLFAPSAASAAGSALQASNLLNPNVSVIGWMQGEAGRRSPAAAVPAPSAFSLKEAEVAIQSVVDPYAKADFFVSVDGDGAVDLEEGYIDWFSLPGGLSLKAGKFLADFGKFNRTHSPETAFADRPLVHERFFGEEGLSGTGAALSWLAPTPFVLKLDAQAVNSPGSAPAFGAGRKKDLLYVGHAASYYDFTEAANAALGVSGAYGSAGLDFDPVTGSSASLVSRMAGLDLTLRWKDPRRSIYRSAFWQTEVLWGRRGAVGASATGAKGLFTHLEYQFARRWRAGARYDYTELPGDGSVHEAGALGYLTFMPSEFSLVSLQGRRERRSNGEKENLAWLKLTFNIGPHGAHPF